MEIRLPMSESTKRQTELFERHVQRDEDTRALYDMFRRALEAMGGYDVIVAELDRKPSFVARISEALSRRGKRRLQVDWLVPMLRHPGAAMVLVEELCRLAGYEQPNPKREVTTDEFLAALLERCDGAGLAGRALLEDAARACGTDLRTYRRSKP